MTQDCQGTCMPQSLLDLINISVYDSTFSTICENSLYGYNSNLDECELYIGNQSSSPLSEENGVDLCGICDGSIDNTEDCECPNGDIIDCAGICGGTTTQEVCDGGRAHTLASLGEGSTTPRQQCPSLPVASVPPTSFGNASRSKRAAKSLGEVSNGSRPRNTWIVCF